MVHVTFGYHSAMVNKHNSNLPNDLVVSRYMRETNLGCMCHVVDESHLLGEQGKSHISA